MKKFLIVGALAIAGVMSAQTQKGNVVISGKSGLGYENVSIKDVDGSTNKFDFAVGAGYFVADNLSIGAEAEVSSIKASGSDAVNLYSFLPSVSYYFGQTNARPYLKGQVGLAGASASGTTKTGLALGAEAGVAYFFTNNFAANINLGYKNLKIDQVKTNTFNTGVGLAVFF
ncbi:outer membrane beta-barrel protein [Ornithobacterium rhinotracheale]|uniref:OprF membrane domain protein n=1 Tax=Ornithobacterium rhinotracheale (strain ATCC 51463 / DSM 15997 / CCUG 23171 / CIP 104009 / LMG 9086) TaxID=867902 RepID=I3ZXX3_ORNRL|nr:outer membrane beta-barrel protein [Ornithobacterium rhinotracheale]AFL96557.1 OprF membrane domain protein [Ornithobacterium rhinotracheale DSM 15997]AIP98742.1 OmpW protein [Ornithobacterium rhinotracheale ORT-UMN 88]KGB67870.1 hypothetical protein Q787_01805 [Ornithobacterium rhinotracheale H06-030791]MCK0194881.1 porin family protein [Ornithobacterium rhinotracheale]MCK0200609.1 porin family protein [Ornithobacterium rhinotracheale]